MPVEIWYLISVFVVAIIGFVIIKRPLYECMFFSFISLSCRLFSGRQIDLLSFLMIPHLCEHFNNNLFQIL